MTSGLSRPVSLSKIGATGFNVTVRATSEECIVIAAQMDIPAVQSLECNFKLTLENDGVSIHAEGRLHGNVTRVCVVSAEDFETPVEDEFAIRFVPSGQIKDDPDPDLIDEIPYDGDTIDLGEATVEQLGLALDPYPRIEGATMPDLDDDQDTSPFAVLKPRAKPDNTPH
jgi:uncharacterized metal-binding protein YceD (DUF177 family)